MNYRNLLKSVIVAASLQFCSASFAGDADFTLTNATSFPIESVYVSPVSDKRAPFGSARYSSFFRS